MKAAASDLTPQVEQRFAEMEAELARLRRALGEDWLSERRVEEIRNLVHEVLVDADARASLLQAGPTAGWDNGFFIASTDGNYRLNIGGNMQFRYIFNHQDDGPEDNNRWGFENTRTQLIFAGHVVNPSWTFRVQGNFNRNGGTMFLEDALIGYNFGNGWSAVAGQFRLPMLREFLIVEPRQQMVERSLVHQEFTTARAQGAAVDYRGEQIHLTAALSDGHPNNGGFNRPALAMDTEFALTARIEGLLAGTWDQFTDYAAWPEQDLGVLLGGAVHFERSEYGTSNDDEVEMLQWTIDVSVKFGRASLFGYIVGRHLDDGAMLRLDQYGAVIQGGYFISDNWEVFARYEWSVDDLRSPNLSVVTAGLTRYFARHRLKWTNDIGYGINEVAATWAEGYIGAGGDIAGWRTDSPNRDGQIVVRSQIQLLF